METFISTSIGIILGGLLSYLISRFYYKKSIRRKSLSIFVDFITEILDDIDPQIKTKLRVSYAGQEIEKLYQIQFVIVNTGDFAIKDIITPLSIDVPNNGEILDISFVYKEPEERDITYTKMELNSTTFNFPLLNPSEFFIVKFLIKGQPPFPSKEESEKMELGFRDWQYQKYIFKITAAELPPTIKCEALPYDLDAWGIKQKFDYSSIIGSIIVLILAFCSGYLIYYLNQYKPSLNVFHARTFFRNFEFVSLIVLINWVLVILITIAGLSLPLSETDFLRKRKKTALKIPKEVYRAKASTFIE